MPRATVIRRSVLLAIAATLLVAGLAAAAAIDFASMKVQSYDPPKPAPAFSLPDLASTNSTASSRTRALRFD